MALSTVVFVGDSRKWIKDLKERSEKLVVNAGVLPLQLVVFVLTPSSSLAWIHG